MKLLLMIFMITLMTSCGRDTTDHIDGNSPLKADCRKVEGSPSGALHRCENAEAICYVEYNGGVSCKFKENK